MFSSISQCKPLPRHRGIATAADKQHAAGLCLQKIVGGFNLRHVASSCKIGLSMPYTVKSGGNPCSISLACSSSHTGFANFEASLGGKWLELLSEIAPGLKPAAIMFNPDTSPASAYIPSFETAARSLKVVPITVPVHSDEEIESAIIALGREPGGGVVAMPDGFTFVHRAPVISAAARYNVPAVYPLFCSNR
jgi:putative ABC transport system substrate-binding protein